MGWKCLLSEKIRLDMLEGILEILPEPLFKSETLIIALNPAAVMAFSDSSLYLIGHY
jgi:hypothetical protein